MTLELYPESEKWVLTIFEDTNISKKIGRNLSFLQLNLLYYEVIVSFSNLLSTIYRPHKGK